MDANGAKISGNVSGTRSISGNVAGRGNISGAVSQALRPTDYNQLTNKPKIEGHVLIGDQTFAQLGMDTLSVQEIEKILYLP